MPLIRSSKPLAEAVPEPVVSIDRASLGRDLQSPEAEVRRAAVRRAARLGAAAELADGLDGESDHGIREMRLTALARIGGPAAAKPLVELLRSEDALLRNSVLEALQGMGEAIIPQIEGLLDDADSDVRIFAVNILQSLRSPRAPELALKVMARDPHANVCAAAVDVLAETGRPEMAEALRAVTQRFPGDPFLRFSVRAALRRMG
jgi:hypothetical protein